MSSTEELLTIARILKPFGIKGELKVEPLTHNLQRYKSLSEITVEVADGKKIPLRIASSRQAAGYWYIKIEGIDAPEQATHLNNSFIQIPLSERLPAPPGQYYPSDLEGLQVLNDQGEVRGKVLTMLELPSVNCLEISLRGKVVMAPMIDACVGEINLAKRTVVVHFDFLDDVLAD